jgi:hypothetical protein
MRPLVTFLATGVLVASAAHAQERRELGAHVHGESTLDIAVEGESVSLALEAPAMDIVGFEHEATTGDQKAAIARSREMLSDPLSLFAFPPGAGCTAVDAQVEHHFNADSADAEHADDPAHEESEAEVKHGGSEEPAHSEFRAVYRVTCVDPAAITAIEFRFFELFPNAEAIDVHVVGANGQFSFEVERGNPHLDMTGSM